MHADGASMCAFTCKARRQSIVGSSAIQGALTVLSHAEHSSKRPKASHSAAVPCLLSAMQLCRVPDNLIGLAI